jgi:hypothetical protein
MILPTESAGGPSAPIRFALGRLVATPAALEALTLNDIIAALARHHRGDWGDVGKEDHAENELSLQQGFRLFSVYHGANGTMFYIITEKNRTITTVLLPSDY